MLPQIIGDFTIVGEPELRFSDKGGSWAKVRAVANDRIKDSDGNWKDGDPLFIDIIIGKGSENFVESASKGDTLMVVGRLKQRTWEKDGEKQTVIQIQADSIGVSTRWEPARTRRTIETTGNRTQVSNAVNALGATIIEQPSEAPF
jgi:single-strand DNA-binding protein